MPVSYWLLTGTAVLMVADFYTTIVGLKLGMVEANPVPAELLGRLGNWGLALFQGLTVAMLALIVIPFPSQWGAPLIVGLASGWCVVNNSRLILRLSRDKGLNK